MHYLHFADRVVEKLQEVKNVKVGCHPDESETCLRTAAPQ